MHRTTQWYPIKLKTQSALISPLWGNTGLTSCSQSADGDWHYCIKLLQHYFIFTHSVKCWAGANVSVAELKQSTKLLQGPSVWTRKFLWWSMKVLLPAQKGNGLTCFITWKKKKSFDFGGQFLVILGEKCTHQTVTKLTLTSTEPWLCLLGDHLTILNIVTYP